MDQSVYLDPHVTLNCILWHPGSFQNGNVRQPHENNDYIYKRNLLLLSQSHIPMITIKYKIICYFCWIGKFSIHLSDRCCIYRVHVVEFWCSVRPQVSGTVICIVLGRYGRNCLVKALYKRLVKEKHRLIQQICVLTILCQTLNHGFHYIEKKHPSR